MALFSAFSFPASQAWPGFLSHLRKGAGDFCAPLAMHEDVQWLGGGRGSLGSAGSALRPGSALRDQPGICVLGRGEPGSRAHLFPPVHDPAAWSPTCLLPQGSPPGLKETSPQNPGSGRGHPSAPQQSPAFRLQRDPDRL